MLSGFPTRVRVPVFSLPRSGGLQLPACGEAKLVELPFCNWTTFPRKRMGQVGGAEDPCAKVTGGGAKVQRKAEVRAAIPTGVAPRGFVGRRVREGPAFSLAVA